jgi:pseudomonalisin
VKSQPFLLWTALLVLSLVAFVNAVAQTDAASGSPKAAARILAPVNENDLVQLKGNVHRLAQAKYDQGAVPDSFALEHMFLQLQRSPEQEQALASLIDQQQDPRSANYHQWLTADELGQLYGPAQRDLAAVTEWLSSHGLKVNQVFASALTIDISGTAAQVREAFHTEIHQYDVNGTKHIANVSDPSIPAALASVVLGVTSLHNFMPHPASLKPREPFSFPCTNCPGGFDNQELYFLAPADFATIYNINPLLKEGITGKGQTIAVLEDTDILANDVYTFRNAFGLASYPGVYKEVHPGTGCTDPGTNAAEGEAAIDAEWSGAVAPGATVEVASCADTTTNFGAFIAASNLLSEKTPPQVMSLSYEECEADNGPAANAYVNSLWQQAASEGVSVFVSSGDGGPAGCDNFDTATYAAAGIAANGLASTPYNTATGGTDFADTATGTISQYWTTKNSKYGESVLSYIPEIPWNDSCASDILYEYAGYTSGLTFCNSATGASFLNIVGSGGGPSFVYPKPSWQAGVRGNPRDGHRDLPDVSFFASNGFWNHALIFCMSDTTQGGSSCNYATPLDVLYNSAGGTSFTAPMFAGVQALIDQKTKSKQGNAAPRFYALAAHEFNSSLASCNSDLGTGSGRFCVFHDVTSGNTNVPCYGTVNCYEQSGESYGLLSTSDTTLQIAYPARPGWDFATGLGSVNVTNLVNAW